MRITDEKADDLNPDNPLTYLGSEDPPESVLQDVDDLLEEFGLQVVRTRVGSFGLWFAIERLVPCPES